MSRSDYDDERSRDPRRKRRRRETYYDGPAVTDSILSGDMMRIAIRVSKSQPSHSRIEKTIDRSNVSAAGKNFYKDGDNSRYHGKLGLEKETADLKTRGQDPSHRSARKQEERAHAKPDFERISVEKVREARAIVKGFRENSVSKFTRDRYKTLSERLERTGLAPEKIAGTKKSFYAYRAAEVFRHKSVLKEALRDRDRAYREKNSLEAQKAEARIDESLKFFSRYQPGGTREENMQRQTKIRVRETQERSNAKRASVSKLPENWRDMVWKDCAKRDRDAIAVTAVTGLRPSELEKGVRIRKANDSLEFRIQGSKVDERRQKGQAYRTITIPMSELRNSVEGRHLIQAQRSQFRQVKLEGSAKAFGARVSRTGARAMPGTDERVSPYTYRHAFSARLKSAGRSPEQIAKAMGHQAERSQQEYGRKSQAQNAGTGAIASASAAKPVRGRR